MKETIRAPKVVGALMALGIGSTAVTGCGSEAAQTWEVGVVCPEGSDVQVGSIDYEPYAYSVNDARIDVICADEQGNDVGIKSMELTKGRGSVINSEKEYTNMLEIKYEDQTDAHDPQIAMDSLTGFIIADNVQVESVAVID